MHTDEHGLFSDFSSVLIRVIPWSLFPSFSVVVYSVFSVALVLERRNVQRAFRGDGKRTTDEHGRTRIVF